MTHGPLWLAGAKAERKYAALRGDVAYIRAELGVDFPPRSGSPALSVDCDGSALVFGGGYSGPQCAGR